MGKRRSYETVGFCDGEEEVEERERRLRIKKGPDSKAAGSGRMEIRRGRRRLKIVKIFLVGGKIFL